MQDNPFKQEPDAPARKALVGKIAELVERSGIEPEDIGHINRVNLWQAMSKDEDGEPVVTDLVGLQLSPAWEAGPEWPVVQPAKPCVVSHKGRVSSNRKQDRTGNIVTVLIPDPQIGYRRLDEGTLIPIHDEQAMACALELLSVIKPDRVVNLGDFLDFAELSSKFLVLPEFVLTMQPTIDRGHLFLAEQQAAAGPQCETWDLLEGNHDNRLPITIAKNAMTAMRLRQANTPYGWPVMSLPHLLRLDELDINYVDGYPAGRVKIASRHGDQAALYALHGVSLSMEKQAKASRVATVQGHAHHFGHWTETRDDGDGDRVEVESWSLGCLCRTDGAVPSTKSGAGTRGRHIPVVESWQHGIGVVVEDDEGWDLTPVRIRNGRARWGDKVVNA